MITQRLTQTDAEVRTFMKIIALLAVSLFTTQILTAQEAGKTLANELVKHWEVSRAFTLAVAEAMPEDSYSFKASDAEMSFGEQMNHIALANGNYCSAALGTKNPLTKGTDNSKATATKNLTSSYDFCIEGLKGLTDADLQTTVSMHGTPVTKFELFWGGFTHAAHHRGSADVYLRLKGVKPPDYKF